MKKSLRILSWVILAVMLCTSSVVPAAAKTLFVSQEIATYVPNSPKAFEERNPVDAPGAVVYRRETETYTSVVQLPDCRPTYGGGWGWYQPSCGEILRGGCYYGVDEGRRLVNEYLDANAYQTIMLKGDKRSFCDGAYYYSTAPDICYYDYSSGKLVAKDWGTAHVSVYTRGGVPLTRLDVNVRHEHPGEKNADTLILTPDNWNPAVGGVSTVSVKSACGKVYNDIVFTVVCGSDRVWFDACTGRFHGVKNGTVILRAYSKSNDRIFGETFLYVGGYTSSVYEGCWSPCKDGISVSRWGYDVYDICGVNPSCVTGWIRTDGICIPVIRIMDAVEYLPDGKTRPTVVVSGDTLSYLDLLRLAYGDKGGISTVIGGYNTNCYGYPGIVYNAYDYRTILLGAILGLIK